MPLPDGAALDRIYTLLLNRRAELLDDRQLVEALELVMEATARTFIDDSADAMRIDLIDCLEGLGARFDPPDEAGQVWAHWAANGVEQSVNVSAPYPGEALRRIGQGRS